MAVSYNRLWKLLVDKKMSKADLRKASGVAPNKPMYMSDYVQQLDSVLSSGNRQLLQNKGTVSHTQAVTKAKAEYRKYQENKTNRPLCHKRSGDDFHLTSYYCVT